MRPRRNSGPELKSRAAWQRNTCPLRQAIGEYSGLNPRLIVINGIQEGGALLHKRRCASASPAPPEVFSQLHFAFKQARDALAATGGNADTAADAVKSIKKMIILTFARATIKSRVSESEAFTVLLYRSRRTNEVVERASDDGSKNFRRVVLYLVLTRLRWSPRQLPWSAD